MALTDSGKLVGRPPKFTPQQITDALVMVIACAGSPTEAHRRLASQDAKAPSLATIKAWVNTHADRYRELERTHGRQLEDIAVDNARRALTLAAQVEQKGLELTLEAMKKPGYRTSSQDALNATKVKEANVKQVLQLTGRPTEVTEHRNVDDVLDALSKRLGLEPIADATIVEPKTIEP